jgi:DNA-binding transcriptional LysR family regulator
MRLNLDVLLILDALDKHGSFATAAESLFKTPAALSYMIQKLESDLNITCWIAPDTGRNLPIPAE